MQTVPPEEPVLTKNASIPVTSSTLVTPLPFVLWWTQYLSEPWFALVEKAGYRTLTEAVYQFNWTIHQDVLETTNVQVTKLVLTEFAKIPVIVAKAQNVSCRVTAQSVGVLKEPLETPKLPVSILVANLIQNVQTKKRVLMELVSILAS